MKASTNFSQPVSRFPLPLCKLIGKQGGPLPRCPGGTPSACNLFCSLRRLEWRREAGELFRIIAAEGSRPGPGWHRSSNKEKTALQFGTIGAFSARMFARHSWTNRASRALLAMMALAVSLIGPARGQRIKYCSADGQAAVIFLSDNAGTFTDGAVDTGMGVYKPYTDCKWVIKPVINEQARPFVEPAPFPKPFLCLQLQDTNPMPFPASSVLKIN